MMSINTVTNSVFLLENKIIRSSNTFKTKKKCNKFPIMFHPHFPGTMIRVVHGLCKVKAKYIVKAKLLHLYFFYENNLPSGNFTCYKVICPTKI